MPRARGSASTPWPMRRIAPSTSWRRAPTIYVFSFYKVYGPHFAVMWGRYDALLELDTLYHYFYGKDKVPA